MAGHICSVGHTLLISEESTTVCFLHKGEEICDSLGLGKIPRGRLILVLSTSNTCRNQG